MGFLAFITGPWGALIQKALLVMSLCGLLYLAVSEYNHHIADAQMMRDQNAQLQQVIKDNNVLNKKLDDLSRINNDILIKLDAKNQKVEILHDKTTTYINSPEAQKSNRPSSDVIKNTIGMLRNND